MIATPGFPASVEAWAKELSVLHPVEDAALLKGRPLLLVHGSDDPDVPWPAPARWPTPPPGRRSCTSCTAAGHWLRADPRVIAILVGWLERHH